MTANTQDPRIDRQATLTAIKAKQKSAERRRKLLIFGAPALAVLLVAGGVTYVLGAETKDAPPAAKAANGAIEGVQVYGNLTNNHVTTPVTYAQTPGVGGDHNPTWTNCGIYTVPVQETRAVHSLEHGAVWLSYRQDLPADQVKQLTDLVGSKRFVLLSPHPTQTAAVTASAWGIQLTVDSASDERLPAFLGKYVQGKQTPEPGAPCTGGVDG